ncbi:unnamed protein product [Rhizoctonia solani]|uniref:F-box domain-containing protein n=1 Tax=Rhizoctonia solani TaxID=456999 RepID=A0A8H3GMK9_9AGAM|nr:unnamed protein product [Rhizoctonia solani]
MLDTLAWSETTSGPPAGPSTRTTGLLDLPPEVLNIVIWKLSPLTLSAFSRTCRVLYGYIQGLGDLLWKDQFLSIWDDPRLAEEAIMAIRVPWFCVSHLADADPDEDPQPQSGTSSEPLNGKGAHPTQFRWHDQVQRRISAEIFLSKLGLSSCILEAKIPSRRYRSIHTILSILDTTPSASSTFTHSRNIAWLEKLLRQSNFSTEFFMRHFLHDADVEQSNTEDRQLTAELQVYFFSTEHKLAPAQARLSRLNARAYVYNIQNYKEEGWHGPWRMTERGMEPNWIHLAACQRVVLENLAQRKVIGHNYPTPPTGAAAVWGGGSKAMATARKNNPSRLSENGFYDWAGAEGVWRRLVCFMDYRDFHEYNVHSRLPSGGLDTSVFKHKLFNEATRIITMTLKITKSEPAEPPFEHRPILHFTGFSVANDTMISGVHGFVRMTASGYVRWRLVTRYDTDDRWVTEAVQLGDAGSAAGFLGTWTGNNHEPDDPAGPTWLWKVADISEMPRTERMSSANEGWVFPDVFFGANIFGDVESDDEDDDDGEDEEGHGQGNDDDDDDEMGDSDDDDENSSDGTEDIPPTLPSLQPLPSLYD